MVGSLMLYQSTMLMRITISTRSPCPARRSNGCEPTLWSPCKSTIRGEGRQWKSVVVDRRYEELLDRIDQRPEREHAWSILSKHVDWWEPGALKPATPPLSDHSTHVFFRISIEQVSGREAKE